MPKFPLFLAVVFALSGAAWAQQKQPGCAALPSHDQLRAALQSVVKQGPKANGGFGHQEWGVVVNRQGIVCAVVFSGAQPGDQYPGSRLIAAEKANTANAVSLPDFAVSTADLFWPSQPGQSLYGLITLAPPNPQAAFGDPATYGRADDSMVGKQIGGMVVFAGGFALYSGKGKIVGALGVSGDTSCTDSVIGWKVRHALGLDAVPMGFSPTHDDNIIHDIHDGHSPSGHGYPYCKPPAPMIANLPKDFPVGPNH